MTVNRYWRDKLAFALRRRVRDVLLAAMVREGVSIDELAVRLGRNVIQVRRWLCEHPPCNLTLDIAAELLLGITGGDFRVEEKEP
jgi:hypothetical protein